MLPFWVFATYFLSVMRAFEKIKEVSIIESAIQNVSKVTFLVFLIFLGLNSEAIIFSFFIGILLLFLFSYFYCRRNISQIFSGEKINSKYKKSVSKEFISYSWPILFLSIISSIFYWIDSLTIGYFKSVTEVGFYNAVIPIALLFNIAPEIFLQLFFPMVTREYALKKIELIRETSKQIGKWVIMINLPALILIFFFSEFIINILFGIEYAVAANSLRILSASAIFSSLFIISNNLMSMAGKSKIIFYDIMIVSIINIILNIVLIPMPVVFGINNSLGINGAAIATTISVIIFNLLFLIQAKHYINIVPIKKGMLNVIVATLVSAIILFILTTIFSDNAIITIFLILTFLLIYVIFLFLFKAFDKEDLMIFQTFKRKIMNNERTKK